MKQMFFNFGVSLICSPVLTFMKVIDNKEAKLCITSLWVGFCIACLINGFICLVKE